MSTGTDIAVREPMRLDAAQIKFISGSSFVPPHYRGKLPEIMACIATGRELGLGDMEALRQIYVVDGKPTLSAELMVKLVRRAGHSITGQTAAEKATVRGKRADTGDEITVTWTAEDAKRAGLDGKANWKNYPRQMLWARAVSELCRMLFPDCLSGAAYTEEEIQAAVHVAELEQATDAPFVDAKDFHESIDEALAADAADAAESPEQERFPIPETAKKK